MKIATSAIKAAIVAEFALTSEAFVSVRRHNAYVQPRQLAMWFVRKQGRSFAEIGASFGGRDHTTVMHACRVMDALVAEDADWRERVDSVQARLDRGRTQSGSNGVMAEIADGSQMQPDAQSQE